MNDQTNLDNLAELAHEVRSGNTDLAVSGAFFSLAGDKFRDDPEEGFRFFTEAFTDTHHKLNLLEAIRTQVNINLEQRQAEQNEHHEPEN